jgi:K+-sensing histidine kinase KdpD
VDPRHCDWGGGCRSIPTANSLGAGNTRGTIPLFLLVVIGATFAFGATAGFVGVAMTTVLSIRFFEPTATFVLHHAVDLVKIEVFAILTTACVFALTHYHYALNASLKRAEEKKSLLFSELAHGVANNFAAIAALISLKSLTVTACRPRVSINEGRPAVPMGEG